MTPPTRLLGFCQISKYISSGFATGGKYGKKPGTRWDKTHTIKQAIMSTEAVSSLQANPADNDEVKIWFTGWQQQHLADCPCETSWTVQGTNRIFDSISANGDSPLVTWHPCYQGEPLAEERSGDGLGLFDVSGWRRRVSLARDGQVAWSTMAGRSVIRQSCLNASDIFPTGVECDLDRVSGGVPDHGGTERAK